MSGTIPVPKCHARLLAVPTTTLSVPSAGQEEPRSTPHSASHGSFSSKRDSFPAERGTRQNRPWLPFLGARLFFGRAWLCVADSRLFSSEAWLSPALAPGRWHRRGCVRAVRRVMRLRKAAFSAYG